MNIESEPPETGEQKELFPINYPADGKRLWNYLSIDGNEIANVLFDKNPEVESTAEGREALNKALEELEEI